MVISQGTQSNLRGLAVEDSICAIAHKNGFFCTARVPTSHRSIFDQAIRLSVLFDSCPLFPFGLAVDALSQDSTGSGAYKVPYKMVNAAKLPFPVAIILDGKGKELVKAREWAKSEASKFKNVLGVFTLSEFEKWLELSAAAEQIMPFSEFESKHGASEPVDSFIQGGLF